MGSDSWWWYEAARWPGPYQHHDLGEEEGMNGKCPEGLIEEGVTRESGPLTTCCNWSLCGAYAADGSGQLVQVRFHEGAVIPDDLKERISAYYADERRRREEAAALVVGKCRCIVSFRAVGPVTDLGAGMFDAPGLAMGECVAPEEVPGSGLCAAHKDVWAR